MALYSLITSHPFSTQRLVFKVKHYLLSASFPPFSGPIILSSKQKLQYWITSRRMTCIPTTSNISKSPKSCIFKHAPQCAMHLECPQWSTPLNATKLVHAKSQKRGIGTQTESAPKQYRRLLRMNLKPNTFKAHISYLLIDKPTSF